MTNVFVRCLCLFFLLAAGFPSESISGRFPGRHRNKPRCDRLCYLLILSMDLCVCEWVVYWRGGKRIAPAPTSAHARLEIIVIMEIPRRGFAVSSISVPADVVEHPQNNPIIAAGDLSSIVPLSGMRTRVSPDMINHPAKGRIREVIGRERRRHAGVSWFQLFSPVLQLRLKSTDRLILPGDQFQSRVF